MSWKKPDKFYVYTYLNENNIPYYVGMGKGRRYKQKHLYVDVPPLESIVIEDGYTEEEAWEREIQLIEKYGRECLNEGPLKNLAPGGKGAKSGWNHSEKIKKQISESLSGVKKQCTDNYKKPKTKEHAANIRKAMIGSKYPKERVENMKKAVNNPEVAEKKRQAMKQYWEDVKSGKRQHKSYKRNIQ